MQVAPQGVVLAPLASGRVRVNGQLVDTLCVLAPGDQITLSGASVLYTSILAIGFDAA